jgi:hypothetical protein
LEDQCERLMGSLEESRRIIEALTKEKDHYKEFWQVTNNYHCVMSRFQVPAPTAAVTSGSFPSQIACSTSLAPLKMTAPPFPRPGYPAFTARSTISTISASRASSTQAYSRNRHQTSSRAYSTTRRCSPPSPKLRPKPSPLLPRLSPPSTPNRRRLPRNVQSCLTSRQGISPSFLLLLQRKPPPSS